MTPLPAQPLPLATTSAFTPRGRTGGADTPGWSRAWTHAAQMQQAAGEPVQDADDASRASWPPVAPGLSGAKPDIVSVAASSRTISSASLPAAATPAAAAPSAVTSSASAPGASTPNALAPSAFAPGAFARSASPPAGATPSRPPVDALQNVRAASGAAVAPAGRFIPCVPGRSTSELVDTPPPRGAAQRSQEPAATPPAPVRVHVERQEDGCVVWLGVDVGAEGLARHIVSELTPSRPGALPVLAVVCNGVPVYTRPRIPKENP